MANSPKKEPMPTDPQDDFDENSAEDVQPLIPESIDKEHGEKLARWLKREIARLKSSKT